MSEAPARESKSEPAGAAPKPLDPHEFDARPFVCGFEMKRPDVFPMLEVCDEGTYLIVSFGRATLTRDLGPFKAGEEFDIHLDYAAGKYIFWEDDFGREAMQYPALALLHPVKGCDQMEGIRDSEVCRLTKLYSECHCDWAIDMAEKWCA